MEDYFDDFDGDLTAAGLPLPLTPKASPSIDFPIEALGPLQEVANSLSEQLQVPIGSVVNSILSLTSLATQDYATVATPLGIECPLCLYFITVTGHAARNALVDNYVFYELKNFERELREKLVRQEEEKNSREDSSNSPDINAIAMQSMHCLSGLSFDTLMKLSPSLPKSTLYESVDVNQFTANARGVLNQAQAQRIGNINKFWKGEDIILMYGHRFEILSRQKLTLKLEVTESTAIERLRADRAGASDLLSKSLVVWPDIRSGNRRQYEIRREDIKGLRTFNDKILNLMSKRSESGNSLQQKTLYLETGALNILLEILETIEDRSKSGIAMSS
ncbi:hypothetical protein MBRA_00971 [Methylobacterium brachiatum]|nr:hypothetical protein MBRA_00971 [Methylobacterium brachiatum]